MQTRNWYLVLALAGAMPFVATALLALAGLDELGLFGTVAELALSYGLAITCFLAGAHWATYLLEGPALSINLLVTSNVIVLGAWIPYVLAPPAGAFAALLIAFACLLYVDLRLVRAGVIEVDYFHVRVTATAVAVASLLIILLSL